MKCRHIILHARVGLVWILEKARYAGHVVHSGASGTRNIDALFFMLMWGRYGFHKKHDGTRYFKLLFLHLVASTGHAVQSSASGV
jgi:hypothetical protein